MVAVILIGLVKIGLLIFEILSMQIDYRILWMGNTVEMVGGLHVSLSAAAEKIHK